MWLLSLQAVADLITVCKSKIQILRPSCMSCDDFRRKLPLSEQPFELLQRLFCKFIVLCKGIDETVSAVRTEPDRIPGKQIRIIDQIDHVSPCMAGNQDRFHADIPDLKYLSILQKYFPVICLYHRELVCPEYHFTADFSRHIPVLDLTKVKRCLREQTVRIAFYSANMICILMSDQDMLYRGWINIKPPHFLSKPVIIVAGIDHDRCPVFGIEKDVGYPFPYAGCVIVDPSGI